MLTASISFSVTFLIIFTDVSIVNGETEEEKCAKQTSYSVLPQRTQSLTTNLFYNASPDLEIDIGFIWAMCDARKTFVTEHFNFYIGASVKVNNGIIECRHADKKKKDCKDDVEHACASKLIPKKFGDFVCCINAGSTAFNCLCALDESKKDEFNQCVQWKHPKIKPDQVLLLNTKAARQADSSGTYPVLTFNGKNADTCSRYMFYNYPIKAICNLLVNCS